MRPSLIRYCAPVSFVHAPSLADVITIIVGFTFSVHTTVGWHEFPLDFQIMGRRRRGTGGLERASLPSSILKNLGSLYGNEPARHHAVKHRQESVNLFLRVDDLYHDRQILREAQELRSVNTAGMA